ncbi:anti-anti-sigma factor [Mycobacterium lacus]|uniref:Anti-sigma factor antagonist n=2 Tax=Mycobacterium lacus TaxID=169765 RepID=A0A1X1YU73_9MYCO|nr:anti-anti-sigma factor [Mycobacterium lacus]BBX95752.1 anti-sigma factor antagonist [Mycobacterium lacus]
MLSTQLVSELGDARSTLRATAQRCDAAVIVYAGGEVDACNERTWRRLLSEVAIIVTAPGSLVIDVTGLDFMACCAFAALADEADRCRRRGVGLCLVSRHPGVARIVHACGFRDRLPVYPTADAALAAAF